MNIKHVSYVDQPCQRCASKLYTAKTWKEKISTYFGGFTEVEYSQIKCSNAVCQEEFEETEREAAAKREVLRVKKEENEVTRKANAHKQIRKALTKRSRI